MRLLLMPLLLSPWASLVIAEPLPVLLDGHEYERRLPSANLPIEAYRTLAPRLHLAPPGAAIDTLRRAPVSGRCSRWRKQTRRSWVSSSSSPCRANMA